MPLVNTLDHVIQIDIDAEPYRPLLLLQEAQGQPLAASQIQHIRARLDHIPD